VQHVFTSNCGGGGSIREENRLRVLRGILNHKGEEVTGEQRELYDERHYLY
jgi:hypothetical protein